MNKITKISTLQLQLTDSAVNRVKELLLNENNPDLKLRVYIISGGCSGFQYGFILDDKINKDDFTFEKNGVILVVDSISIQYLAGGSINYKEGLKGSCFTIINPNAKTTCSCGYSFSL